MAAPVNPQKKSKSGGGARKIKGKSKPKYERYRMRVGKPRGPGVPGAKSGARYVRKKR